MFNSREKRSGERPGPAALICPCVVMAGAVLSTMVLMAPAAQAQTRRGSFNLSGGLAYASAQTTNLNTGQTSSGDTKTGLALTADYRYPVSSRFSIGPAIQYWSLADRSNTSLSGLVAYRVSDAASVHLAIGNDGRVGYSQLIGKGQKTGKGLFVTAEYVASSDDLVDSFGYLGLGYRF